MTPFRARVRREGAKANLCITVPAPIAKQLTEAGFGPPGWVRLSIKGHKPVFVVARRPPSRPSVTVTLPVWAFDELKPGVLIHATVEDATPYRARQRDGHDFDWLPYVDFDTYLPVDTTEYEVITVYSSSHNFNNLDPIAFYDTDADRLLVVGPKMSYAFGGDGTGLGTDLTEPVKFLDLLQELGIRLVCISVGSPYYNPHFQRPAFFPPIASTILRALFRMKARLAPSVSGPFGSFGPKNG